MEREALVRVIADYTHEAGVRELERQLGAVIRGVAAQVARGKTEHVTVTPAPVAEMLGPARHSRHEVNANKPGIVTGLAYTPAAAQCCISKRRVTRASAHHAHRPDWKRDEGIDAAALSLVRSRDGQSGLTPEEFATWTSTSTSRPGRAEGRSLGWSRDVHRAGFAFSATRRCVPIVAMTGEITLRGLVLPIGGLKEKSLAAMRAGITTVIIPSSRKDLIESPEERNRNCDSCPLKTVDEVLKTALEEAAVALTKDRARRKRWPQHAHWRANAPSLPSLNGHGDDGASPSKPRKLNLGLTCRALRLRSEWKIAACECRESPKVHPKTYHFNRRSPAGAGDSFPITVPDLVRRGFFMNDNPADLSLSNFIAGEGGDPLQAPPSFTRWMQAGAWAVELYEPELCAAAEARTTITYDGKPHSVINLCSYNYLGLANHPEVIAAARCLHDACLGACGSPCFRLTSPSQLEGGRGFLGRETRCFSTAASLVRSGRFRLAPKTAVAIPTTAHLILRDGASFALPAYQF